MTLFESVNFHHASSQIHWLAIGINVVPQTLPALKGGDIRGRTTISPKVATQARLESRMDFDVVGTITGSETISQGNGIRDLPRLRKVYGAGNWRKKKGTATVRFGNGATAIVELHWYETHGIGRREEKIKTIIRVLP